MSEATIALDIEHLSKNYGRFQALKDVSLQIEKGEFFGFLGPNAVSSPI